ncbi:hypothetical protein [Microviridae sp.]|nr:hypothetical protein [Microviridae sp.]
MTTKSNTKKKPHLAEPKHVGVFSQREYIRLRNQDTELTHEYPDPTPVHIPGKSDLKKPLTLRDEMQRYIANQVSLAAQAEGTETFAEANDFDVEDDDLDYLSVYTVSDLQPEFDQPRDDLEGDPTISPPVDNPPPQADVSGESPPVGETLAAQNPQKGDPPSPPRQ